MKFNWDIQEWVDFGDRFSDLVAFYKAMKNATREIAAKLHNMIIQETPVDFGTLQAFWQTEENYAYVAELTKTGVEVTLINRAEYATWVNDGHKQRPGRFIPGYWVGDKFRYDPNADEGMVLKKPFVQGKFFVEKSILKLENNDVVEKLIMKELEKWFRWCVNGK